MQSQENAYYTESVYSTGDRFCLKTYCYVLLKMESNNEKYNFDGNVLVYIDICK
jgi:hypothetical protein